MNSRRSILSMLCALGLLCRIPGMFQGLWFDEIVSATRFVPLDFLSLLGSMRLPNHHPFYTLLAKFSALMLGESEWTLRLPALIFGALTPPLIFLVGEKPLGKRASTIGACLFAVSFYPVWIGNEARGYSPMIFFSLLATWLFLRLRDSGSLGLVAAYVVGAALAMYSHLYGGAVIAAHGLIAAGLALRRPGGEGRFTPLAAVMGGLALGGLLYAPMLSDLFRYASGTGRVAGGRAVSAELLWQTGLWAGAGYRHPWLSIPVLVTGAAGLAVAFKRATALAWTWLLAAAVGLLTPLAASLFAYPRFYSYLLPLFFLFIGAALDLAWRRWPRVVALGLTLAVLIGAGVGLFEYFRFGKQGFDRAADFIAAQGPERPVAVMGIAGQVFSYYCPRAGKVDFNASNLGDFWVVLSYPSTLSSDQLRLLSACGLARVFPSAGAADFETRVYDCGQRE